MNIKDYEKAMKYSELRKVGRYDEAKEYADLSHADLSGAR
jgi:hypothetical protein